MRTLYTMPYSPWSERARWALLHHRLQFLERAHMPLVGEIPLRIAAHRLRGNVSVPMLVDGSERIMDSFAIAEYSDRAGGSAPLFPGAHAQTIRALNDAIEPALQAARARVIQTMMRDDEAALSALPAPLKNLPGAAASARLGGRFIARKHPTAFERIAERIRAGLVHVKEVLSGREHVFDEFTYADIIAATTIHLVAPVADRYMPIDAVTRRIWTDDELARDFGDLIAWRDAIYARHRPTPGA